MLGQMLINGIMLGSTYALMALGLNLIFGIMGILNFAHGQMYMLGTFVVYYIYGVHGSSYILSLVLAVIILMIIGIFFERYLYRRVINYAKRGDVIMLLSMGTALLLENSGLLFFGEKTRGVPPLISVVYKISNAYLPAQRLLIFLISSIIIIIFLILMQYTKKGRALRALAQDKEATYLQGVNVNKLSMIGFGIGASLAGVSGAILALIYPIYSGSGTAMTIKAFVMIMIGGAGVLPGAILGGFILGMLESFGYGIIGGSATYLFIFIIVISFLVFRPNGIMGKPWG